MVLQTVRRRRSKEEILYNTGEDDMHITAQWGNTRILTELADVAAIFTSRTIDLTVQYSRTGLLMHRAALGSIDNT